MSLAVLLVQRDHRSGRAILEFLTQNGFEVDQARDGDDAIWKLLHERKQFNLLIYDFDLPQADKVKTAVALRSVHRIIPTIVLTRFPSITTDSILFRGSVEFLKKPLSLEELLSVARRAVGRLYRRKRDTQTWHVCVNCKDWPVDNYEEQQLDAARELELCNECRLHVQRGVCL